MSPFFEKCYPLLNGAKNTCARVAESRVAIAAEAKVATMGETAVASENASGMATRIGAPSKPIWSKTKDLSSAQNALKHWRDHGKQFEGIQNSKQYVENVWKFRDRTDVLIKVRANGERVLYDHPNNTFGVFTREGVPKTMFKPIDRMEYFKNQ